MKAIKFEPVEEDEEEKEEADQEVRPSEETKEISTSEPSM